MPRRFTAILATVLGATLLALGPSAGAVGPPTNDVPLDLEVGAPFPYPPGSSLAVFNLYWDADWDANNPGLSMADLDDATEALVDSDWEDSLSQYLVPDLFFSGSAEAVGVCGGTPAATTSSLALIAFLLCEESVPFTGVPFSFADHIYNVIVPTGTTLSDFGSMSCVDYQAYHFVFPSLPAANPLGLPGPGRPIIFTVIPAACASSVGNLMSLVSHEVVEAATDPTPTLHWIDFSTIVPLSLGSLVGVLSEGEAADICDLNGFDNVPQTFGGVAMRVSSYWSNAENACVIGESRVVQASFGATGLPAGTGTVIVDGVSQPVGYTQAVREGTTFSFPEIVTGGPGIRFTRPPGTCSGTVAFPAGNTTANAAQTITCAYSTEYFLTVETAPAAAAVGNATLTASDWHPAGTLVGLTADPFVSTGSGSRYAFQSWQVDGVPSLPVAMMSGPRTATAVYQREYLLTVATSGLGANATAVRNGVALLGSATDASPLAVFVPSGTLALAVDDPVNGAGGVQYFFQGFTPAPPASLTAAFSTVAEYQTMAQQIDEGLTSGDIVEQGGPGVAGALGQQWNTVEADLADGDYEEALDDIESFVALLQAQSGKKVSAALATALQLDAADVYYAALCRAVSLGQISARTHAAKYAYYSSLVTSLGGVPRPDC